MSDLAVQQVPGVYEPSLFGTYSKKIGMWLFLLSVFNGTSGPNAYGPDPKAPPAA